MVAGVKSTASGRGLATRNGGTRSRDVALIRQESGPSQRIEDRVKGLRSCR